METMGTNPETESLCANPRCRKPLVADRDWLGYCNDTCAWGHKEKDDVFVDPRQA